MDEVIFPEKRKSNSMIDSQISGQAISGHIFRFRN